MVDRNAVLRRHIDEHASEPVVSNRSEQIGRDPELGAAECGRHRIAAKRNGVIARNLLLVAGRNLLREECYVDIGLTDKERLHADLCSSRPAACLRSIRSTPGSSVDSTTGTPASTIIRIVCTTHLAMSAFRHHSSCPAPR